VVFWVVVAVCPMVDISVVAKAVLVISSGAIDVTRTIAAEVSGSVAGFEVDVLHKRYRFYCKSFFFFKFKATECQLTLQIVDLVWLRT
jgi:hypothetical protein